MKIHPHIPQFVYAGLILIFGALLSVAIFTGTRVEAQLDTGIPFGGLVATTFWCSCSENLLVYFNNLAVNAPAPTPIMFQPGVTILHPFYEIYQPGVWILGNWGGEVACIVPCGKGCCTTGVYPMMIRVGTSMPG